jgi:hypothetical protein
MLLNQYLIGLKDFLYYFEFILRLIHLFYNKNEFTKNVNKTKFFILNKKLIEFLFTSI